MLNLKAGKWYPIDRYYQFKEKMNLDWVLVQFQDTRDGFEPLPRMAEYSIIDRKWHSSVVGYNDVDDLFNEQLEPKSFMIIKQYKG
jgi:hypothetical protein